MDNNNNKIITWGETQQKSPNIYLSKTNEQQNVLKSLLQQKSETKKKQQKENFKRTQGKFPFNCMPLSIRTEMLRFLNTNDQWNLGQSGWIELETGVIYDTRHARNPAIKEVVKCIECKQPYWGLLYETRYLCPICNDEISSNYEMSREECIYYYKRDVGYIDGLP